MKKLTLTLCTAIAAIGLAAPAGAAGINLYNAHEFDLDIFGTRAFASDDRLIDQDANGGGLALTYFFTEYIGVGLEGTLFETRGDTLATTAANAVFRMPLADSGVALYGIGGVGMIWNPDNLGEDEDSESSVFEAHLGAGGEWRFSETFGIFADWRYNFVDRSRSDYSNARIGMRFAW